MMIVRHPTTGRCMPAMAIKFIHHEGAANRPKPHVSCVICSSQQAPRRALYTDSSYSTIFYFTPTRNYSSTLFPRSLLSLSTTVHLMPQA